MSRVQVQTQHQHQDQITPIAVSFEYAANGRHKFPEQVGGSFYEGGHLDNKFKKLAQQDRNWFHRFASASGNIPNAQKVEGLEVIEEIRKTDPEKLKEALGQKDKFGWKPMHYAAWCGSDSALESLVSASGEVSDQDMGNMLFLAMANNRAAANFKKLTEICARSGRHPEEYFFTDGSLPEELAGAGLGGAAVVRGGGAAAGGGGEGAAAGGRLVCTKNLLDIAAEYGNVEVMEFLLNRGRLSIDGMTDVPVVDQRHSKPMDENNPKMIRGKFSSFDKSPLYLATKGLHVEAVRFLIAKIEERNGGEAVERYVAQRMHDRSDFGNGGDIVSLAALAAREGLKWWNNVDEEHSSHDKKTRDQFKENAKEGFFDPAGYHYARFSPEGATETARVLLHVATPEITIFPFLYPKEEVIRECVIPERVEAYRMPILMEALFATANSSPLTKFKLSRDREPYPNIQLLAELLQIKPEKEKSLSDIALLAVLTAIPGMDTDDERAVRAIEEVINDNNTLKDFTPEFRGRVRDDIAKYAKAQIEKIRSEGGGAAAVAPSGEVAAAGGAVLDDGGVEQVGKDGRS
jgi:ankyrin repeat protein